MRSKFFVSPKQSQPMLWRVAQIFLPLGILLTASAYIVYHAYSDAEHSASQSSQSSLVQLQSSNINADIAEITSDLLFLASQQEIQALFGENGETDSSVKAHLSELFLSFSRSRKIYDQIRVLDERGQETIRVNFNQGQPAIVPPENLQNKKGRYYFDDALALGHGQVFVSPLDLNVEQGKVEQPIKPMIRFGTPIIDSRGKKRGIVLLNYFGNHLIQRFAQIRPGNSPAQSMLINRDGFWLHSADPETEWGFMYPENIGISFQAYFPQEWERIQSLIEGQFETDAGLFTFQTVNPLKQGRLTKSGPGADTQLGMRSQPLDQCRWKVVSYIPSKALHARAEALALWIKLILAFLMMILLVTSWNIASATESKRMALERAKEASRTKSRFLSNMSHEIRTPMNGIMGMIELALDDLDHPDAPGYLTTAKTSADTLLRILSDILDLSKMEAGKLSIEKMEYSLQQLLSETFALMKSQAESNTIDFELVVLTPVPPIFISDPTRLKQCLINLLSNAIKFTQQGHVHLRVAAAKIGDEDFLRFEVVDTGVGIPRDKVDRIFEAFEQEDASTTRRYGGTGLGLSITKQLAELLGGRVWAESTTGQGSTFTLEIPVGCSTRQADWISELKPGKPAVSTARKTLQQFRGQVLVVEDNLVNQKTIQALLEKLGLQTTIAKDGQEAVDMAEQSEYDLVFMDLQMPVMNGLQATAILKERQYLAPIVALTANVMESEVRECFEVGCSEFLGKPIKRAELISILDKYLVRLDSSPDGPLEEVPVRAGN